MASDRRLTIGLIGAGDILASHLAALKANPAYRLTALCSLALERLKVQTDELGVRGYTDYRELLARPPDVVLISLPHHLHHRVTLDALEAGCHCLVEKPFAVSMTEVNDMLSAARAAARALVVTESSYWLPVYRTARDIVRSNALGRFLFGNLTNHRFYFTDSRPGWFLEAAASGGGQFMNIGMHRVAAVRCILGDDLEECRVTGSVHRVHADHDIEAATQAMVVYADGEAMTYEECGYATPPDPLPRGLHLVFEHGLLGTAADHVWTSDRAGTVTQHPLLPESAGGPYGAIYGEMLKAIDGKPHYPTAVHGARDVRIALAAYASADRGMSIDLRDAEWTIR